MPRTSSSIPDGQTGDKSDDQDDAAVVKSPPLISDQKAGNDGSKLKDDGEDAEDPEIGRQSSRVCVIDVGNEEARGSSMRREKVCRICHLGSDHLPSSAGNKVRLVDLGCACKGDLGVSHYYCAHAWFLQKGNRTCEICGKPAENIKGIGDTGFRAFRTMSSSSHDGQREERENQCSKSLCNFILAAIILAFFLPWFFHPGKRL
ncbi:hypothetical protein Cgig2_026772 [Carnegiea gigantea]|uniref:RING-CH-type domain-containing protein n=1 Tax=Carnegiea gigantea TaxID=171969 RepID=A0A9Q1JKP2_9CARY|nr:hypothetical protein Cgig2_026772 [Carnegiea gigantea]